MDQAAEREGWEAGRRRKELAAEAEKARSEERRRQEEDSSVARQRKDSVHRARPVPQYRWGGGPVLPPPRLLVVQPSDRPVTVPLSPALLTRRAGERRPEGK
jgi:hypothetical protein